MGMPPVAPDVLGNIISMAVAPVFLISSLFVYLGLLSGRAQQISLNLLDLLEPEIRVQYTTLINLQRKRLRRISLAFREVTIANCMVCIVVLLLFVNVMVRLDLAVPVSSLFVLAMLLVVHSLTLLYSELQLALASAQLRVPGGF